MSYFMIVRPSDAGDCVDPCLLEASACRTVEEAVDDLAGRSPSPNEVAELGSRWARDREAEREHWRDRLSVATEGDLLVWQSNLIVFYRR